MFVPSNLNHKDIVDAMDADDLACAFLKDSLKPGEAKLPDSFVAAHLVNGNKDLQVLYAPDHKFYKPNADNTLKATLWAKIKSFGTGFSASGARPQSNVPEWRLSSIRNSIGLVVIDSVDPDLNALMKDQMFGISLIQEVLDANVHLLKPTKGANVTQKTTMVANLLWNEKGVGGKPDHCIVQLPALYALDPTVKAPRPSAGPSPRKRGGGTIAQPPKAAPLPSLPFPTTAGIPGTLYPPSLIPGYDTTIFEESCRDAIRAVQPAVYDTFGNLVLPCHLENVLVPDTIVKVTVSFHAWYSGPKKGACATTRAEEVRILQGPPIPATIPTFPGTSGSSTVNPSSPKALGPTVPISNVTVGSGTIVPASVSNSSTMSAEVAAPTSTPSATVASTAGESSSDSNAPTHAAGSNSNGGELAAPVIGTTAKTVTNIDGLPLNDSEYADYVASLHPDTSPHRKRRVKDNQEGAPKKKRKGGKK